MNIFQIIALDLNNKKVKYSTVAKDFADAENKARKHCFPNSKLTIVKNIIAIEKLTHTSLNYIE